MELKTFNMISIGIEINYNSEIDEKTKKEISNKIITGLKSKLVPYNIEELVNQISSLKLKFKLKNGARCVMTEPKLLINDMIIKSLQNDKELINYILNVESE